MLAGWLAANEKPLATVVEASKRPRRYDPFARSKEGTFVGTVLPADRAVRDIARALVARATLELHEGKIDAAWEDLLTCRRLARLVGQGLTLIDALVAISVDSMAFVGDQAMLQHAPLSAAQVAKMRDELAKLPPMPMIVDKINVHERCGCLDLLAWEVANTLDSASADAHGGKSAKGPKLRIASRGMATVDLDPVLRMDNVCFDQMVDACRKPTRAERKQLLTKINADIEKQAIEAASWKSFVWAVLFNRGRHEVVLETIGRLSLACELPATSAAVDGEDRGTMQFELTKLAFALAAYRADNGSYPNKLAGLVPKYVAEVPKDLFSDSDLHYQKEGGGYLLYSVGVNGRDDGGKTSDDDAEHSEGWDDLVIRMPAVAAEQRDH
jgi:hypothetical protein